MSQQREAYRNVSVGTIGSLIQVVIVAMREARAEFGRVDLDDVEQVLDLFRVMWPGNPEVTFLNGMLEIERVQWREAAETFRSLAAASKCLPRSRAMLAYALHGAGDVDWRAEADALRDSTDPDVVLMVRSLLGMDDLKRAVESGAGPSHVADAIELAKRLRDDAEAGKTQPDAKPNAAASVRADAAPHWMSFQLRA